MGSPFILALIISVLCCFVSVVNLQSPRLSLTGKEKSCRKPIIEITVSPLISERSLRELDISWDVGEQWRNGDWIGLYNTTPSIGIKPIYTKKISKSSGWLRTGIPEGRKFSDESNFNKICLGFWAVYWKGGSNSTVTSSCLGTNPRWMEENKNIIRNLKLNDLFIPGTHDSAAFHLAYSPFKETRYHKYVFAQDESVLEQLIHGARYLDFRLGYYESGWWLNHGIVKVHPLEHVLDHIKLFLNSTQEIVILDFHEFPVGFKERQRHYDLVKFIKQELGSYIAPPWLSWNANLGQLWDCNRRLILAYNDKNIVSENADILWWPVVQKWPNVRSLNSLYSYFLKIFQSLQSKELSSNGLAWSAMAELTPNTWIVISDKFHGLRNMAYMVNRNVTGWFRGDWGGLCNAVAVDFIRSTGIVDAAIRWNVRKALRSNCDP